MYKYIQIFLASDPSSGRQKQMKSLMTSKKGQIMDALGSLAIGAGTLAMILVIIFLVLGKVATNSQVTADSNASAAIATVQNEASQIPQWVGIVIITIIGFMMIAIFQGRRQ